MSPSIMANRFNSGFEWFSDSMNIGMTDYTSRILKGGALLNDMRSIMRHWSRDLTENDRFEQFIQNNLLGKNSRTRALDIYRRAFKQRFIQGNPPLAWQIVKPLETKELPVETISPLYYWVTARSDNLLYDFVSQAIFERSSNIDLRIRVDETAEWIDRKLKATKQKWTDIVKMKVARGILATLRDFGILEGAVNKKIAPVYLPVESFAYIAFALYLLGNSGEALIRHSDWRLFLLNRPVVEHLFIEAHQRGLLTYEAAGNLYRIDFPARTYTEMANVLVRKST